MNARTLGPLFVVQFFAWTGMFALWIYTTPVVLERLAPGAAFDSDAGAMALTWVGACFATYATIAACLNFAQGRLAARFGRRWVYAASLLVAGAGITAVARASGPPMLIAAFALVGLGWSAISTIPYAIVGERAPPGGETRAFNVFAFSIVLPQGFAALVLPRLARLAFGGSVAPVLDLGAAAMVVAALAVIAFRIGD